MGGAPMACRPIPLLTAIALGLAASAIGTPAVRAQDYPARPVTLIVPFAPGGSVDVVARVLSQKLAERFGKPVLVENRPGAGTVTAASAVAKAAPDGHTLLLAVSGTLAINANVYKKLPYDPVKSFAPIALVDLVPTVLVVNTELPVYAPSDLIKLAKQRPGQLSYGSSGLGSSLHLSAELLKSMTGIEMTHVPYRGGAQAIMDVIAGHVELMFADPASALPQIRDGKVRALGVSSVSPVPAVPEVPPIAEAGVPGFEAVSWQMIVAPAHTPKEIVNRLHTELKTIAASPDVRQTIVKSGLVPIESPTPAELGDFVRSEIVCWRRIVETAGLIGSE